MDRNARIIELIRSLRKIFPAHLHNHGINFHHIDPFNLRIARKLTDHTAVARADDQRILYMGMHRQRDMRYHLVINKFVLFGQHHIAVQHKKPPEFRRVEYVNALMLALTGKKLTVNTDRKLNIRRMLFGKPEIHVILPSKRSDAQSWNLPAPS